MKQFLLFTLLLAFTASAFEFTGKVVGLDKLIPAAQAA